MPYPKHNRQSFYKYTSASTAAKIIERSNVRYSSPRIFNDPFDIQSGLHFDFEIRSLPDRILKRIEDLVRAEAKPPVSATDPWGQAITLMWEKKASHGLPKEELLEMFRPALVSLKDQVVLFQSQYQSAWWNDFLPRLRVFSVAEENDNLLMWSHYADCHTGVVLEFRVLAEHDNPLCVAEPVVYRKTPPPLFTEEEWLNDILSIRELDRDALYFRYAYIKSDIWVYEKEWRVWDLLSKPEESLHSDYPVHPQELVAIFFGCKIAADTKASLLESLARHFPDAQAFQATKAANEFAVEFHAV